MNVFMAIFASLCSCFVSHCYFSATLGVLLHVFMVIFASVRSFCASYCQVKLEEAFTTGAEPICGCRFATGNIKWDTRSTEREGEWITSLKQSGCEHKDLRQTDCAGPASSTKIRVAAGKSRTVDLGDCLAGRCELLQKRVSNSISHGDRWLLTVLCPYAIYCCVFVIAQLEIRLQAHWC